MKNLNEEGTLRAHVPEDIDEETKRIKRKVIDVLKRFKAAYLAEIAFEAGLSEYQVRTALNILNEELAIERIPVSLYNPDTRLLLRVPDQSQLGQGGYTNFSRKRWYGIAGDRL